jgi:hypothetical protein
VSDVKLAAHLFQVAVRTPRGNELLSLAEWQELARAAREYERWRAQQHIERARRAAARAKVSLRRVKRLEVFQEGLADG